MFGREGILNMDVFWSAGFNVLLKLRVSQRASFSPQLAYSCRIWPESSANASQPNSSRVSVRVKVVGDLDVYLVFGP